MQLATRFTLVCGAGEGDAPLTAFDAALLDAGVGNLNLVRISSVMPAGVRRAEKLDLPVGSVVFIAYGTYRGSSAGERIAAAIGVATAPAGPGMIMEYAGPGTAQDAESQVRRMLREAFARRSWEVGEVLIKSAEHVVSANGAVFAGCALW
jgi:arginine decarboxylase